MIDDVDKEWPFWTDKLGHLIYPGDFIAVATINGRSPQMVIARVERINRINSKGEEVTQVKYIQYDEPVEKTASNGKKYMARGEYQNTPSCTITATPVLNARDFTRWGAPSKKVTYQIPENCVKVDYNFNEDEE